MAARRWTAPPGGTTLPLGLRFVLDASVRSFAGGTVLTGGHPGRILRLTADGPAAVAALTRGEPSTVAGLALGRRLVDAGMAFLLPPAHAPDGSSGTEAEAETSNDRAAEVTVVIPVHDRSDLLERCLGSLSPETRVVVVDDASHDPGSIADVCRTYGARLVTRAVNGGPGAARNDGLRQVDTALVAFLDSDCVAGPGWLAPLVRMFDDPLIAAVAPRIHAYEPTNSALHRFTRHRSPLDMGPVAGEVGPDRLVRYVPTAALVVRCRALHEGPEPGPASGFDTDLRFGEDVDLVWSLIEAGWHVGYLPSVKVEHQCPTTWRGLLRRRYHYGTSAGPLARRHPGRLAPVELRPWPTVAAFALLSGQLGTAAVVTALYGASLARQVRPMGIPPWPALKWSVQGTGWTAVGLSRWATVVGGPVLVAGATGMAGSRRVRRAAAAMAILPPVVEWWRRRSELDLPRWVLASVAEDIAYGIGVWSGCVQSRAIAPVLPSLNVGKRT
ncbi:MAG: mycofactocin biosynthesis glycosyltransferase MftF [Acidimicrobiales bacterium]